jgi:hypothetical protein
MTCLKGRPYCQVIMAHIMIHYILEASIRQSDKVGHYHITL